MRSKNKSNKKHKKTGYKKTRMRGGCTSCKTFTGGSLNVIPLNQNDYFPLNGGMSTRMMPAIQSGGRKSTGRKSTGRKHTMRKMTGGTSLVNNANMAYSFGTVGGSGPSLSQSPYPANTAQMIPLV